MNQLRKALLIVLSITNIYALESSQAAQEQIAATKIQALARGHKTRREIKEAHALAGQKTYLLTVFLDNSEVSSGSDAITAPFLSAIYQKMGIIIASTSLLYNIKNGSFAKKNKEMAEYFNETFDIESHWIINEIMPELLIMIPRSFGPIAGLRVDQAAAVSIDEIANRYTNFSRADWDRLDERTRDIFVNALIRNRIFDENNKDSKWVVFLAGHGSYGATIASISLKKFSHMLGFFERNVNTALLVYLSCYAAGYNAKSVYGELTKQATIKQYSFPIVTQAVADTPVYSTKITFSPALRSITTPIDFGAFIKQFKKDPYDYEQALAYIMPDLKAYESITNIAQIRFPHIPMWFLVTGSRNAVVRITQTMAHTRSQPLMVKSYKDKGSRELKDPQALLFYVHDVPFEIIINTRKIPYFIIPLSGDVVIRLQQISIDSPIVKDMSDVQEKFILKDSKGVPAYKGKKIFFVKKIIGKGLGHACLDVIFNLGNGQVYYTNAVTKSQYRIDIHGKITQLNEDYHVQFSFIFNEDMDKENRLKRLQWQKLEKTLAKKHTSDRDMKQLEEEIGEIDRQIEEESQKQPARVQRSIEEYMTANTELKNAIIGKSEKGVKKALLDGATVEMRFNNKTPLMLAAEKNSLAIVRLLLQQGASVNAHDDVGTALMYGAGNFEITKLLLEHQADILNIPEDAEPLLYVEPDDHKTMSLLKDAFNTEINAMIERIATNDILKKEYLDELRGMLELPKITDQIMIRAKEIRRAINEGKEDPFLKRIADLIKSMEILALHKDISKEDKAQLYDLIGQLVTIKNSEVITEQMAQQTQNSEMIYEKIMHNVANAGLKKAIIAKNEAGVKKALLDGADVEVRFNNKTPLILAAEKNSLAIVRLLLQYGASVNARDDTGTTALMYGGGNFEITKLLLEHHADILNIPEDAEPLLYVDPDDHKTLSLLKDAFNTEINAMIERIATNDIVKKEYLDELQGMLEAPKVTDQIMVRAKEIRDLIA